jgi:hypothetical protein
MQAAGHDTPYGTSSIVPALARSARTGHPLSWIGNGKHGSRATRPINQMIGDGQRELLKEFFETGKAPEGLTDKSLQLYKEVAQSGRVAQVFDLEGITDTAGAPSFAFCAKGGSRECLRRRGLIAPPQQPQQINKRRQHRHPPLQKTQGWGTLCGNRTDQYHQRWATRRVPLTRKAAKLRHPIPKRNLPPACIHAHRPGFVQKIETITAPTPLLRRLDQSLFHRIAMHIPQLLHALLRRPYVEVVGARLPERSGGWPRFLISRASPTQRVPRPSRPVRRAGTTHA